MNKLTRKTFLVDESMLEKMDMLMKHHSYINLTELFRHAMNKLYNDTFDYKYKPVTAVSGLNKEEIALKNAEIKAKAKGVTEKVFNDQKLEKKIQMCSDLFDGEVKEDENGNKVCVYTQYTIGGDNEITIPLVQVDPVVASNSVFLPSKEAIFKNRPDVRKKYEKKDKQKSSSK